MTEKFYKALSISVVPIVMGGADYAARAPPRSYINVLDYESPQELAEYLLHLASHEEEYQQYFWWKVSTLDSLLFTRGNAHDSILKKCFHSRSTTPCTRMRERGRLRPCASCVRS